MRAGPATEAGGEEGEGGGSDLRLDVANLESEACEWAAIQVGRIRSPFGIYSLQFEPAFLEPFSYAAAERRRRRTRARDLGGRGDARGRRRSG